MTLTFWRKSVVGITEQVKDVMITSSLGFKFRYLINSNNAILADKKEIDAPNGDTNLLNFFSYKIFKSW